MFKGVTAVTDERIAQLLQQGENIKTIANELKVSLDYIKLAKMRLSKQQFYASTYNGTNAIKVENVQNFDMVPAEKEENVENETAQEEPVRMEVDDRNLQIAIDYEGGMSTKELRTKYSVSAGTIYYALKKCGIQSNRTRNGEENDEMAKPTKKKKKYDIKRTPATKVTTTSTDPVSDLVDTNLTSELDKFNQVPENVAIEPIGHEDVNISVSEVTDADDLLTDNVINVRGEENTDPLVDMREITYKSCYETYVKDSHSNLRQYIKTKCVEAGLVSERHGEMDQYVRGHYVYDSFGSEMITNYVRQEEIALKFIRRNLTFTEGVPNEHLVVYLTGLQCALVSIIKACLQMKVNLVVKHWDTATNKYRSQVVFSEFPITNKHGLDIPEFDKLKGKDSTDIFVDNDIDLQRPLDGILYCVTIRSNERNVNMCRVIFKNDGDARKVYKKMQLTAINDSANISLYLDKINIVKREVEDITNISKMVLS